MDLNPARATPRRPLRRALTSLLAGAAALALAFAGIAITPDAQGAQANPAASAGTTTITALGAYSGTVPAGVCSVTATVLGGAGGSAVATTTNANGAGARITATYPVVPGLPYSGTVGGGGGDPSGSTSTSTPGPGGSNGGGIGGSSETTVNLRHHGAGGGGYSELLFGGTLAVLAGGGGGAGGGHSTTTEGAGGNAGLPAVSGVTAGSAGNNGRDTPVATVGAGGGGTSTPGAGGVNSASGTVGGSAGSGRTGGAGGDDPNLDAGGGGGGGYAGGGGGASTVGYNQLNGATEIAGAGGGGGSSYVAPTIPIGSGSTSVSGISSIAGAKLLTAGDGANGSVSLQWNSCVYDLAVDKSVSPVNAPIGSTVTWTIAVTNLGPSAMSQGDTVTIADTLPGAGAKTITAISVSGGSNAFLGRGTVTCSAAVGAAMPASLDCSRPYQIGAGAPSGVRGLDVGETLTVTYTQPITESAGTVLTNTATVVDRTTGDSNDSDPAATTVIAPPTAVDDVRTGLTIGAVTNVTVTSNDIGTLAPGSVVLWNPGTLSPITSPYVVPGEGTWTVVSDVVTFTPEPGFASDPTPVTYRVTATNGLSATATVTLDYLSVAVDDSRNNLVIGSTTTVPVLTNDNGTFNTSTLRLVDPGTGTPTASPVVVPGQGTWSISGADVVFTPAPGFLTDPSPITYRITDTTGGTVSATVTLDYVPAAADDSDLGNVLDTPVDVSVLPNDTGSFAVGSLVFVSGLGTTLVVPGEGTWTVQPGGVIRFTPEPGYQGDPTPVGYRITDTTGDSATALVTITYVPSAADDSSLGNAFGSTVNVNVLANDNGTFVTGTVAIMDGVLPVSSLTVPGEGTWIVQPDDSISFVPEPGFLTDPAPIFYRVQDTTGDFATAVVTVTYLPLAVDDSQGGLTIGSVATVPVLVNDQGDFSIPTLRLVDPGTGTPTAGPVTIAGQGVWTISGANVVFTPEPGFLVDPDPITYRITDSTGDTTSAQVELDYGPGAADDNDLGNVLGTPVDVSVFDNDSGTFDPSTLGFGGATGPGATLVVPGEGTWTVLPGGVVNFTPEPGFLTDPTPVRYYADDITGDPADALITITYLPAAADDSDLGNAFGTDVNVDVLVNDTGSFTPGSVLLLDGVTPTATLYVPGEGTWTVQLDDTITFEPDPGFLTDPGVVNYQVTDVTGDVVTAAITVTYLPLAADDAQSGLVIGSVATVPVLANDDGDFVVSSLRIVDPGTGTPTTGPVTVPGQGVWTISGTNVVFTPAPGFLLDPDPISYRITDSTGDTATAQITLGYVPAAADDSDLGNTIGDTVDVSVWVNDTGSFDITTLGFGGATGVGATLVVAGEGTWSVLAGGVVRFVPEPGFQGDPTPVTYYVNDVTGDPVDAVVTITYVPAAADDSDLGNAFGTNVNVDVLGNDTGAFVPGSVRIMDGMLPVTSLVVPGEGTWTVEPDDTITFDPEPGFLTDPTAIFYRVQDTTGDFATATVTVGYLPAAADDADLGNTIGTTVNVPVLTNDSGDFVLNSVRIVTPGGPALQLVVPGEGTWEANSDGTVTFFPEVGFLLDPAPVSYEVTDVTGDIASALVTITYVPTVAPDVRNGNVIGSPAVLNVLGNDTGDFDVSSLRVIDPGTNLGVLSLVVPGQGTWTVDTLLGRLTFTPEPGFMGNPTPVNYEITDLSGDVVRALATVTYLPTADDDESLNNPAGSTVRVPILGNDVGLFAAGSARLLQGGAPVMSMSVPGEGTWRMQAMTGTVSFEPFASFTGNPTPVTYRVTDVNGNLVTANVTITYLAALAALGLTGMSVDVPLWGSITAIMMGLCVVLFTRLRRVARHRL